MLLFLLANTVTATGASAKAKPAATKVRPVLGGHCVRTGTTVKNSGILLRCTRHGHILVWMRVPKKPSAPKSGTRSQPNPVVTTSPSPVATTSTNPDVSSFITAVPIDLAQVLSISRFRSCSGHDYSSADTDGNPETNRSMKHYINPIDSLIGTTDVIKVFAPFDGQISAFVADNAANTPVGEGIWLTPSSSPAWTLMFFHITPVGNVGDYVKAGQLIGYANLSRTSVRGFDIALEEWVHNIARPAVGDNLATLEQVHQQYGDYLQLLHRGQLDSIFNHMTSDVLGSFATRGMTLQAAIVSEAARDASPCPQPVNGHYPENPDDNVPLR
ncbi:MAG TPA: hypothetical protein VMV52_01065 [Candidatus Nanopelagicaceae bacterium]|nr:hypothetical protein [Candidatus Nanopelagicaceae bacterium]